MRLWLKLALAMVAVALAPLVVVSLQALELTGAQADAARKAALEREAVAVADEIGRWVTVKAQAIAGWTNLYPELTSRPVEVQQGLLRAVYRAVPGVVTAAVLDADGLSGPPGAEVMPVSLDASLRPGDPLADRPRGSEARTRAFLQAVSRPEQAGEIRLGPPYVPPPALPGGPEPDPVVVLAARSPFGDDTLIAVELSLDEVDTLLGERSVDGRAFALLTLDGSAVIAHGSSPPGELLRPLLGQPVATLELTEAGRVGALAGVPGVPWTIVMTEASSADGAWARLRWRLLVAFAVSLVVAGITGVIVARSLSRPIAELRTAANRVADGDLAQRVPAGRKDEVGELAAAFNHMAVRLATTLKELESRNKEIEAFNVELKDRVAARTRELELAQEDLVRAGQLAAVAEVGAGLAHELNNPLASVLGVVQVLRARSSDGPFKVLLGQAETEALRCREVVDAMLRISGTEGGGGQATTVVLTEAVEQSVRLVEGAYRSRGVQLRYLGGPADAMVRVDPVELSRILTQVLQALCAGMREGAALEVAVARVAPDRVEVRLTSDGPIAAGARRDDYLAAGLGVWVARKLLAARGGLLDAPETGEGTWRLVLPSV